MKRELQAGLLLPNFLMGWLGSRVVSVLDSNAEGPEFKIAAATLFSPIVPLFTKQRNW